MKKILVFCFVFVICFSCFGIVANAQIVQEPIFEITASDLYQVLLNYSSYFEYLRLQNGVLYFQSVNDSDVGSISIHSSFGVPNLDPTSTYRFEIDSTGFNIRVRYSDSSTEVFAEDDVILSDITRVFLYITNSGSFVEYRGFRLYEVPDPPPVNPDISGDSSDFGNFIIPMARTMSVDTWNVFKSCWWALAFILVPLVYFLVVTFIGLFKSSKPKYKNKYKANKFNYKGFKKSDKDFKKHFKAWVVIDGVRYYRSRNNFQKQPVE